MGERKCGTDDVTKYTDQFAHMAGIHKAINNLDFKS